MPVEYSTRLHAGFASEIKSILAKKRPHQLEESKVFRRNENKFGIKKAIFRQYNPSLNSSNIIDGLVERDILNFPVYSLTVEYHNTQENAVGLEKNQHVSPYMLGQDGHVYLFENEFAVDELVMVCELLM